MLDYFKAYYVAQIFGPGYVATNITYVIAAVLLLNGVDRSRRGCCASLGRSSCAGWGQWSIAVSTIR